MSGTALAGVEVGADVSGVAVFSGAEVVGLGAGVAGPDWLAGDAAGAAAGVA